MAVARAIVGPQERFERSGAQSLRDIRPLTTRLSEGLRSSASGLVLGIAAFATFLEPAVIDVTVPLSALYALWVLTRRVKLPDTAAYEPPDHTKHPDFVPAWVSAGAIETAATLAGLVAACCCGVARYLRCVPCGRRIGAIRPQ